MENKLSFKNLLKKIRMVNKFKNGLKFKIIKNKMNK